MPLSWWLCARLFSFCGVCFFFFSLDPLWIARIVAVTTTKPRHLIHTGFKYEKLPYNRNDHIIRSPQCYRSHISNMWTSNKFARLFCAFVFFSLDNMLLACLFFTLCIYFFIFLSKTCHYYFISFFGLHSLRMYVCMRVLRPSWTSLYIYELWRSQINGIDHSHIPTQKL